MSGGIEGVADAAQGALVADAAAGELTRARGKRRIGDTCANCGTKLQGPHCHVCGQAADDLHRPFWSLIKDGIEGLFALDSRFFKTVPALLFRPGRVTKSYLDGARARYVPPFRLYLVAAVVFLLAVSTVTGDWTEIDFDGPPARPEELADAQRRLEEQAEEARAAGAETRAAVLDQVREELDAARDAGESAVDGASAGDAVVDESSVIARARQREREKCRIRRAVLPEELGSCPAAPAEDEDEVDIDDAPFAGPNVDVDEDGNVDVEFLGEVRSWPISFRRLIVHQSDVVIDNPNRFLESVNAWISRVLIGLFPVYALILAVTHFWKRRFYFYDHLIVSMHLHSFIFVLTTLLILLGWLSVPIWLLCLAFVVWSNIYLYKTHRVVYGCGRFSSAFRTLVLDMLYFCVLLFVPVILVISGFLTA